MMNYVEVFIAFLGSPEWARCMLAAVLFLYGVSMPLRPPFFRGLMAIPLVLIVRDVVLFVHPDSVILILSEIVIVGLYISWVGAYRHKPFGFIELVLTSVVGAVILVMKLSGDSSAL